MYRDLHVLHFILYLVFAASLYDGKMPVVRSLARPIHGIARQIADSNYEGILGSRHL